MILFIFNYFWQSYYNFKITNKNDIINYRLYSDNGLPISLLILDATRLLAIIS